MTDRPLPPVIASLLVPLPPARAFALFTERMATWWPLRSHSVAGERAESCFIEPFAGGRVFERSFEGDESDWGRVIAYEPPHRLSMTWHPGGGPTTEVEVRFTAADEGTLVEVEHRGWEAYGDKAAAARGEYASGWALVLTKHFGEAARGSSNGWGTSQVP